MKLPYIVFLLFSCGSLFAQKQDKVDFIRGQVALQFSYAQKAIEGKVTYEFEVLENVDSVFLDARKMEFRHVLLNGKNIKYKVTDDRIIIFKKFKKNQTHTLKLGYWVQPEQTVYFTKNAGTEINLVDGKPIMKPQIWTQGQGKYTSYWLPSFDDMEEKVEFDLTINGGSKLNVIANGRLKGKEFGGHETTDWTFDMEKPMSSYLLAFVVGDYRKQELTSKSGIPIENYYYPKDSLIVEPTYRYTKEIFDFMESEIGVPYPWQNYKQIPVHDFLYAGMENTTATIFSDGYVIDSTAFIDKNYVNVNAHELAHQWFGNLVTEKDGNHHWLHEGFATYYAYLAEQKLFGDDHFYWKLYNSLQELQKYNAKGEGQSLTNPEASSLTFYEKGAWALFMLRNRVGDVAFKKGIQAYLNKYQFNNVSISNFIETMEMVSNTDLSDFENEWLQSNILPYKAAKEELQKASKSLQTWFLIEASYKKNEALNFDAYYHESKSTLLKKQLVDTYYNELPETLILKIFNSNELTLRQVLAKKMDSIPPSLKNNFETLLADQSYITIEQALFKLWAAYPKERSTFLEQTKNTVGLPNKNVRLLWLTLAILTNEYDARNTKIYFQELSDYTAPRYNWEIRMGAFQYLHQTLGLNTESLKNLIQATIHHSWQFKKFARNLVDELIKDADYKERLLILTKELKDEELRYINTKLKE